MRFYVPDAFGAGLGGGAARTAGGRPLPLLDRNQLSLGSYLAAMDDNRDPRDEKEALGQTAKALRQSKDLSQDELAKELGVRRGRISEIEGGAATGELLQEIAERLGYRAVHVLKTMDLFESLKEGQRRPFDPIGPTPEQEVELYEASRALGAELEAIYRGRIRRENLERALDAAAGQWGELGELKDLSMSQRRAEIRRNADFHTWAFCLFLCEESIRWATDQSASTAERSSGASVGLSLWPLLFS